MDDFDVQSKQLRPTVEQFAKNRMEWFKGLEEGEGVVIAEGGYFNGA